MPEVTTLAIFYGWDAFSKERQSRILMETAHLRWKRSRVGEIIDDTYSFYWGKFSTVWLLLKCCFTTVLQPDVICVTCCSHYFFRIYVYAFTTDVVGSSQWLINCICSSCYCAWKSSQPTLKRRANVGIGRQTTLYHVWWAHVVSMSSQPRYFSVDRPSPVWYQLFANGSTSKVNHRPRRRLIYVAAQSTLASVEQTSHRRLNDIGPLCGSVHADSVSLSGRHWLSTTADVDYVCWAVFFAVRTSTVDLYVNVSE